jgi:hypothetical protein
MAEEETVKIQIEIPKDQLQIAQPQAEDQPPPAEEEKSAETELKKLKAEVAKTQNSDEGAGSGAKDMVASVLSSPADNLPLVSDKSPPSNIQKIIIGGGLAVALAGLILWPVVSFKLGISVAVLGAIIVATGSLIKIGH